MFGNSGQCGQVAVCLVGNVSHLFSGQCLAGGWGAIVGNVWQVAVCHLSRAMFRISLEGNVWQVGGGQLANGQHSHEEHFRIFLGKKSFIEDCFFFLKVFHFKFIHSWQVERTALLRESVL